MCFDYPSRFIHFIVSLSMAWISLVDTMLAVLPVAPYCHNVKDLLFIASTRRFICAFVGFLAAIESPHAPVTKSTTRINEHK